MIRELIATIGMASPSPVGVPGAGLFQSPILLSLLVWVPAGAALVISVLPNPRQRNDVVIKQIAFFTNLGLCFVLFIAYNQFASYLPTMQFEEKLPWLPAIGVNYHLGVDGPAMVMLVLSGLVGVSSVLASWGVRDRVKPYFCLLLLTESTINGSIVAHDMFVLLMFWGASIIPVTILILGWGGPRREGAAWRLVGYWGLGTAALLAAVLILYAAGTRNSFDMDVVLKTGLSPRTQLGLGVVLIIAAATRLPLFPFHGWARDVYSEAPTGLAVIVAGSASRLGLYLLIRTLISSEADGSRLLAPFLAALAAITVAYAALAALRSVDLRHAAAYLALVPGGVSILGLAGLTPLSITGAIFSLFTGGLAAALIIGVCATTSDRAQTRNVTLLGGLGPRMPNLTWLMLLAALALLGIPLMASYPAELMTFFGAFRNQPVGAFAVAAGLALTAIALAVILHRILFGSPNPDGPAVSDSSLGETWYLALLAGALLWVGIFPSGPKLPGTDQQIFDPGLVNVMSAGITDIASPYAGPTTPVAQ
jgi:NADH-quinone oxidoreductase subunit M